MPELSENFNKLASDLPAHVVERDSGKLDPIRQSLFADMSRDREEQKKGVETKLEGERPGRTATNANRIAALGGLDFGTARLGRKILPVEVSAMMLRADQEKVSLLKLTPQNAREDYIQRGYVQTLHQEQVALQKHDLETLVIGRKLVDQLLQQQNKELGLQPEKSLNQEFNRAAGRSL